jgi:hypothetical protein
MEASDYTALPSTSEEEGKMSDATTIRREGEEISCGYCEKLAGYHQILTYDGMVGACDDCYQRLIVDYPDYPK